jgi:hypothetical protein
MDGQSIRRPYETDYKKAMRTCLVILGAISCAQAALSMPCEDYELLLATQDRMCPTNLVINIAKAPNPQVIHFDACLALPCGDLSYQRQLSQEDK